jgi:hypothetical protein
MKSEDTWDAALLAERGRMADLDKKQKPFIHRYFQPLLPGNARPA